MSLLGTLFPFVSPIKSIVWLGERINEIVEAELFDKSRVNEKLLELQMWYEMGEMSEEEFREKETDLLRMLDDIIQHEKESKGP